MRSLEKMEVIPLQRQDPSIEGRGEYINGSLKKKLLKLVGVVENHPLFLELCLPVPGAAGKEKVEA